ncbi:MAG: tetratricopeptide repeat protein [Anaerolineales bacterium]|nr:tetratricopeptide repeat protein [Anaerolineales bacterium]MCB8939939.1 tetratricopeptide repeat protein [Ardenticatenaceae bacterium]
MTSILLHEYVEQVEKLIDANRLVEAIEHCRHILHHYPRHIDTYRMMGKALLEKPEYDAASDLFLRILGADPNDFISHVGLSIIYKEQRQYDQALWHLERAYEIQPYNVAIQGELRQLYAVETETRPGIIPLTRGALARLYMKGELYQQAISELRRILLDEPERMDLLVLLAEALWRDQQRIDAEEVCLKALEELPNCIVLNAILAEIWLQTGRISEAQKYLHRLHGLTWQTQKTLNRESIPGKAFATEGAFALPVEAPLEFLETGTISSREAPMPADDWVGEVKFEDVPAAEEDALTEVVLEPESGMHSYDWLADIGEAEAGEEQKVSETDWFSQKKAKDALNLSTDELNADWLADLRGEVNEGEESGFQPLDLGAPAGAGATNWFSDEDGSDGLFAELDDTGLAPTEDTAVDTDHDWLNILAEEDDSQESGSSALQYDATNLMDDSLLGWADEASEPHVVEEPKTPFWLSQMSKEDLEAVELNPEDALDWLAEGSGTVTPDSVDSQMADAASKDFAELDDALDWLNDLPDEPLAGEALLAAVDEDDDVSFGPTAVLDPEEQSDIPATRALTDTDSLGGADDWLAALTEGTIEDDIAWDGEEFEPENNALQVDANTNELSELSDADDWLEAASADFDAILDSASEDNEFPNLALSDMEDEGIADIPDWLYTDNLEQPEDAETAMSSENDPQDKPQPEKPTEEMPEMADASSDDDALDWLEQLTSEGDEAAPLEPPIATEGMPSWLDSPAPKSDFEVVDEWESESANIPDWLQEPVELSDLDDDALLNEPAKSDTPGLTGLLSEMELPADDALGLHEMDSLLADWMDEDGDDDLAGLLDEFEEDDSLAGLEGGMFDAEDVVAETAVSPTEDPSEEIGLTGLLSNLSFEDEVTQEDTLDGDGFLTDLLADVDNDDDLSSFWDDDAFDSPETAEQPGALDDLEEDSFSLTAMLSEIADEEEEPTAEPSSIADDDWLADLAAMTEDEEDEEPAEAQGLTGMLASLWPEAAEETESDFVADEPLSLEEGPDLEEGAVDDLGLTELLAGIDYVEEAIDSMPELPDLGEPVEPSLTEILSGMEVESDEADELEDFGPVSAEDTTWLTQLEADTGSLQEQADTLDLAEETGLDWLTLPEEPEAEEPTAVAEPELVDEPEIVEEQDSVPEDWDDPMSWLEELAAQREDPVAELPSVAENMLDEELDSDEMLSVAVADEPAGMNWLDDLEESDAWADEQPEPDMADAETQMADDTLSAIDELEPVDFLDDWQDDNELSWLDELATGRLAETAVDEAETHIEEDLDLAEPEEIALGWLDETDDELLPETAVRDAETEQDEPEAFDTGWLSDLDADEDALPDGDLFDEVIDELGLAETAVEDSDISWLDTVIDEDDEEQPADAVDIEPVEAVQDPDEIHRITGVTDALKADDGLMAAEADLEDALAWLDEIGETGELPSSLIDEAPPTRITPPEPHDVPQAMGEEDHAPDTIVLSPEPDELALALDRLEQQVLDEGIDVPETAVFPIAVSDEDLFAALDWIEQEAQPETADELVLADQTTLEDDPEAWLEDLLSADTNLDIDMTPPPIKPSEDAMFVTDDAALPIVAEEPTTEFEPETADSLLDDLELEGMPEDPDAAVAWLDQLVSGDDALDIEMEPPPIKPSEDAMFVTEDAAKTAVEPEAEIVEPIAEVEEQPVEEIDDLDFASMEDDPEGWLEQMLSGDATLDIDMAPPPIKPSEDAMFVTEDAARAADAPTADADEPEFEPTEISVADDIIAEVPDDPDEAMAWLEQLAARRGADLAELPSVTDVDDEPIMPDWMVADVDENEPIVDELLNAAVSLPETGELADGDVDFELPDWLNSSDNRPVTGETGWLTNLPEIDMDSWLTAEEEATTAATTEDITLPDTGPLRSLPKIETAPLDEDDLFEPVSEPSTGAYSLDEAKLGAAQDALADGRIQDALAQFKKLVSAGSGMMAVIVELEQATDAHPQVPALFQVLGDAYMRNGQLQKALASYRSALDQM